MAERPTRVLLNKKKSLDIDHAVSEMKKAFNTDDKFNLEIYWSFLFKTKVFHLVHSNLLSSKFVQDLFFQSLF